MRRFKITVTEANKAAGIFSDKPVLWDVIDTKTGKKILFSVPKETAVERADLLEGFE